MNSAPKRLRDSGGALGRLLTEASGAEAPAGARVRNWARVSAALTSARWRWPVLALGLAMTALAVFVLRETQQEPPTSPAFAGKLVDVRGPVKVGDSLAKAGASLSPDALATTDSASHALLEIPGATALLLSDSALSARKVGMAGAALHLSRGSVVVESNHRARGAELTVEARAFRVTVVGTVFSVAVEGDTVLVRCARGAVRVTGPEVDLLLPAPGTWSSRGAAPPNLTATQVELMATAHQTHALSAWPVDAAEDEAPLEATPASPEAARGAVMSPNSRSPRSNNGSLDEDAQGLALYEQARAQLHRADAPAAATLFREYRQRFPRGPLTQEAWLNLLEALVQGNAYSEALAEADAFLKTFPTSERRSSVLLLKANIYKDKGDCVLAMMLYEQLARTSGRDAEPALFFLGLCQGRANETAKARTTLKNYLARYPKGRFATQARQSLRSL